ncbi:MAG: tRNA pseudouridine(55) synthase TruB [Bacteroidales bacterium]|nr:tRNA pseudouridine(55) synthase TruB [Bacteroidales bacterium]
MLINEHTDFREGQVLLFDKPLYWTSFDLVKKVKNLLRNAYGYKKLKVGHAGTLDPLARGLMIICTGRYTKKINEFQDKAKEYVAGIQLGKTTPSFDLETEVDATFPADHVDEELLRQKLSEFEGEFDQVPPLYSAKRYNGGRAYDYARKGIDIKLEPKKIVFHKLELMEFDHRYVKIRILCSKGTYIRSFARDLGAAVNSGAYLSDLARTAIGEYRLEDAMLLKDFELLLGQVKENIKNN